MGLQRRMVATAAAPGEAPAVAGVAAQAFPFLTKLTPAEAAQPFSFGSLAASMTEDCAEKVRVIRCMDSFEAEVYTQPPRPLGIFFAATFNTHNKLLLEQFIALAKSSNSNTQFLVVDVDEVPRAAYHCGVSRPYFISLRVPLSVHYFLHFRQLSLTLLFRSET